MPGVNYKKRKWRRRYYRPAWNNISVSVSGGKPSGSSRSYRGGSSFNYGPLLRGVGKVANFVYKHNHGAINREIGRRIPLVGPLVRPVNDILDAYYDPSFANIAKLANHMFFNF